MNQPRANPEEIQEMFSEIDMNTNPQAFEGECAKQQAVH